MASLGRVTRHSSSKPRRSPTPLNAQRLEELALRYVSRFATTRVKAAAYLNRKLRERGWADDKAADIEALISRLVGHGYIDDAAFAEMKARSLGRRGYGKRRVDGALHAAGVAEEDREGSAGIVEGDRVDAAWRFAQRKRLGPFASAPLADRQQRDKAVAAFLRAGHAMPLAIRILGLPLGAERNALDDEA
jgi:regulatory protein